MQEENIKLEFEISVCGHILLLFSEEHHESEDVLPITQNKKGSEQLE